MRRILIALGFILAATSSLSIAQERGPRIRVKGDPSLQPIEVSDAGVNVDIHGYVAETSITLRFNNPNDRILEGDLYFPLPDGAVISGFSLDVNGKMVDGVVVEKAKARQAFETEVRRNIDPGLVEAVKGNNFKTRVYPLPANGSRTVTVRYLSELNQVNSEHLFVLPLNFEKAVNRFKLKVEVLERETFPVIKQGGLSNFAFKNWKNKIVAEAEYQNLSLTEDLIIEIPDVKSQEVAMERTEDGVYALINCAVPELPTAAEKAQPWNRVTLFWDASASRRKADHNREFALLRSLFAARKSAIQLSLIVFRNEMEKVQSFEIADGNIEPVIEVLKTVGYDGGTQLGALNIDKEQDLCLLFSDGISNFGAKDPSKIISCPIYSFGIQSTADHSFLRYLAMQTGGRYFNLQTTADGQVVEELGQSAPVSFLRAEVTGADGCEFYPSMPTLIDGRFLFSCRLPGDYKDARVTLTIGHNEANSRELSFDLTWPTEVGGELLRKNFGRMKIQELVILKDRNKDRLVEAGKQYGMVTPGTSLLVLENLGQYIEHRVEPPKSLPDMRNEYLAHCKKQAESEEGQKNKRLEEVIAMWKEVCDWHSKKFTYDLGAINSAPKKASDERRRELLRSRSSRRERTMVAEERAESEDDAFGDESPSAVYRESGRRAARRSLDGKVAKPGSAAPPVPTISIKPWTPDTPYLEELKKAADSAYPVYLQLVDTHGEAPSFYLDCANFFLEQKQQRIALRVLSNIVELELENPALLRVLGHRLSQLGELKLAISVFEEVLELREEDPQSYRDLALVLAERQEYTRAVELLYTVAMKPWGRFAEIEKIALVEMNRILKKAEREGLAVKVDVDPRLVKLIDTDVRIVMTWDADNTDMDLWVTEPSREKCYYSFNRSTIGGRMSRDFTRGYGPEEYMVRKAAPGEYKIESNFYGSSAQKLLGAVTLQVAVFTDYGRPTEKHQDLTFRLTSKKEVFTIGTVKFGKGGAEVSKDVRHYQIKPGDTLYSIAAKNLGDGNRWKEIQAINPGLKPEQLKVGQIIVLP